MKPKIGNKKNRDQKATAFGDKATIKENQVHGKEDYGGDDDNVTNIHKRYSLTLINPSSHYVSLALSIAVVSAIVIVVNSYYFDVNWQNIARLYLPLTVALLIASQFLDSRLIKTDYSKSLHISLFGNLLWFLTVIAGLAAFYLFSKSELSLAYVVQGMLFFTGFRICLFVSVAGASFKKSILLSFLQPLLLITSMVPFGRLDTVLTNWYGMFFGYVFIAIGLVWAILSDRAGRPGLHSTHRLLQAYLEAATKNSPSSLEHIMEQRSVDTSVGTYQLRLYSLNNDCHGVENETNHQQPGIVDERNQELLCTIVLPDIHPGPFHPIGGSNISFEIYKSLNSSAVVMHSISDHSLNLPSELQVRRYIDGISNESNQISNGTKCSVPVIQNVDRARVTGMRFGNDTVLLMLSLSPYGMEDIPLRLRKGLETQTYHLGFSNLVLIDCHNAMGPTISEADYNSLMEAAKITIDRLAKEKVYKFSVGYASYFPSGTNDGHEDVGPAGIAVVCIKVNEEKFLIGWADSNNMQNGIREKIVDSLYSKGYNLIEICTSDTHYRQNVVRNKEGYFSFGSTVSRNTMMSWFEKLAKKSGDNVQSASYSTLYNKKKLKLMGPEQFKQYSSSLDRSMKITKVFVSVTTAVFLASALLL